MDISCLGLPRKAFMTITPCHLRHFSCNRSSLWQRRSQLLTLVFFGMMMGGFITAQYLYLWAQRLEAADGSIGPAAVMQVEALRLLFLR